MIVVEVIVNWLHMVAGFTWLGGLIFVNVVLSPVVEPKGIPPEFVRIMGMERFRWFAWGSIGTIILSGVLKIASNMAGATEPSSLYLGAILIKIAIVAVMIVVTFVNSIYLRGRLANAKPTPGGPSPEIKQMGSRLVILARVNLALGGLVLLMVAIMRAAQ